MAMKDHATTGGVRTAPPDTGSPVPLLVVGGILSAATVAWVAWRRPKKRRRR